MSNTQMQYTLITRDYWMRFLKRSVPPQFKPDFKRSSNRYPLGGMINVKMEEKGRMKKRILSLIDVSIDGMTAKGLTEVSQNTNVLVEFNPEGNPFCMKGKVAHCTETVGGYKIGIELIFE